MVEEKQKLYLNQVMQSFAHRDIGWRETKVVFKCYRDGSYAGFGFSWRETKVVFKCKNEQWRNCKK